MTLKKTLKKRKARSRQPKEPLWKGPEVDGVTQSMLSGFLECRERFRLRVIRGLRAADKFNHAPDYGHMWHICEEAWAANARSEKWQFPEQFFKPLSDYVKELQRRYPLQQEQILHWANVCRTQFPIYVDYWAKHKDVKSKTPILQEQTFEVPYELPSGRVVKLRGKWDSVDLIGKGKNAGVWLQENKTKGEINEEQMQRQMDFDLQTMFYMVALQNIEVGWDNWTKKVVGKATPLRGVYYNIVRRPLSGGKGSIKPLAGKTYKKKKDVPPESMEHFYARLGKIISDGPEFFFMRWQVIIGPADIERFKVQFLNPILEQLCDWYDGVVIMKENPSQYDWSKLGHWRTPYGLYSALAKGRVTELDEYLATGSKAGLQHVDKLFKELG